MIAATRDWFKRNRRGFAIGAGVLGAGYVATQYVIGKLTETRQRMSDDRIARENLRRRFEQNQEDCTFTVLAILPTATENILEALPVEQTLNELQKQKAERLARSVGASEGAPSELSSAPPSIADDDEKSLTSFQSESYVHASQIAESSAGDAEGKLQPPQPLRPKKSKVQLWNEMKISSIARVFTLIYTLSLLTLLTRIQLNLLGRRNYLASVVSLASPPKAGSKNTIRLENHDDDNFEQAYGNDFETNRKYLSFSWWLLHRGCKDLMEEVLSAVREVFGPINPREDITLDRLSQLTVEVRKKIEGATEEERKTKKWLPFLLPSPAQEEYVLRESGMTPSAAAGPTSQPTTPSAPNFSSPPSLRRLLDETSDLIDSPSFTHVLTLLLDSSFTLLMHTKIAHLAYKIPPTSPSPARVQELVNPAEAKAKFANTLAVFCRQAHVVGRGEANEYLDRMGDVSELGALSAVVYSSNFEWEGVESAGPATSVRNSVATGFTQLDGAGGAAAAAAPWERDADAESTRPATGYSEFFVLGDGQSELERTLRAEGGRAGDSVVDLGRERDVSKGFEEAWGKALKKGADKGTLEENNDGNVGTAATAAT